MGKNRNINYAKAVSLNGKYSLQVFPFYSLFSLRISALDQEFHWYWCATNTTNQEKHLISIVCILSPLSWIIFWYHEYRKSWYVGLSPSSSHRPTAWVYINLTSRKLVWNYAGSESNSHITPPPVLLTSLLQAAGARARSPELAAWSALSTSLSVCRSWSSISWG